MSGGERKGGTVLHGLQFHHQSGVLHTMEQGLREPGKKSEQESVWVTAQNHLRAEFWC